jgi:hypothetical protein
VSGGVGIRLPSSIRSAIFHTRAPDGEESVLRDVAPWVVSRGEAYYREVRDNPDKTPARADVEFPTFSGELVRIFSERFNEWISLVASEEAHS